MNRRSWAPKDRRADVFLPDEAEDGAGGLASCDEFTERLQVLSRAAGSEAVPIVFVTVEGLEEVSRRHGSMVADRISVAMAHGSRAQLRRGDTAVSLIPGELLILLAGQASEHNAMVVARRLKGALTAAIRSLKRRHAELVKVSVEVGSARLRDGRLQVVVGGERLVDAPVAQSSAGYAGGVSRQPLS